MCAAIYVRHHCCLGNAHMGHGAVPTRFGALGELHSVGKLSVMLGILQSPWQRIDSSSILNIA